MPLLFRKNTNNLEVKCGAYPSEQVRMLFVPKIARQPGSLD